MFCHAAQKYVDSKEKQSTRWRKLKELPNLKGDFWSLSKEKTSEL
jgi:hypothetical protein